MFDGRDITHAPPEEIAPLGIAQVPGGHGVFPPHRWRRTRGAAGWMLRHDSAVRRPGGGGARPVPDPAPAPRRPAADLPAASSRCWRSPWRSCPSPSC
ncbi:MAG: hypothetical protein R2746_04805 [Acidimicrobiales bacterium]